MAFCRRGDSRYVSESTTNSPKIPEPQRAPESAGESEATSNPSGGSVKCYFTMRISHAATILAFGLSVSTATLVTRQEGNSNETDPPLPEECRPQCQAYTTSLNIYIHTCNVFTVALQGAGLNVPLTCASCLIPLAEAGQLKGVTRELLEGYARSFENGCAEHLRDVGGSPRPTDGAPAEGNGSGTLAICGRLSFAAFFVAVTCGAFYF
ncbi:hypothetical protein FA15DRAFT_660139 [Coprinopsis marcescibilis]|uniref:Uncharacterized protein n=1 Tax=Coprinopsis marcescibilis TaxID=230819 RepID=A0A5C3KH30_COPMA|nr:hypothetical protein FA15DRAFT_660139 [Coprinopsis marcescibilis]